MSYWTFTTRKQTLPFAMLCNALVLKLAKTVLHNNVIMCTNFRGMPFKINLITCKFTSAFFLVRLIMLRESTQELAQCIFSQLPLHSKVKCDE